MRVRPVFRFSPLQGPKSGCPRAGINPSADSGQAPHLFQTVRHGSRATGLPAEVHSTEAGLPAVACLRQAGPQGEGGSLLLGAGEVFFVEAAVLVVGAGGLPVDE